jgi:hypothetical protein
VKIFITRIFDDDGTVGIIVVLPIVVLPIVVGGDTLSIKQSMKET